MMHSLALKLEIKIQMQSIIQNKQMLVFKQIFNIS